MIGATSDFAALQVRLARMAEAIVRARADARGQAERPDKWRHALLLWPTFGQE